MIATVFVEDSFDSAHWLPHVSAGHKCRRVHGHTYRICLEVTGPVEEISGWVIDYDTVKKAWNQIKAQLDHHELNDIAGLENPTCESLAYWISERLKPTLPGLSAIHLRETERCGVRINYP